MIAGIILAAGASSRMGRPKALLEYRGETFAGRLVRVLSKVCDPVIVVLGHHADAIRERAGVREPTYKPLPMVAARGRRSFESATERTATAGSYPTGEVIKQATFVVNPDPDRGQLSSLQTALGAVPDEAEGFLFTPVDCPTVSEETVAKLVGMLGGDIVIPRYEGRRGHPVCVPRSLVAAFLALAPTEQTRVVVNQNADRVVYVDVDDPGILADIDDPEAYRALAQ